MTDSIPGLEGASTLSRDVPGIPGRLKSEPDDFRVEELPLYPPSGEGDHFLFRVEKRGLSTPECVRLMARALGLRPEAFGYAGLKDARAVSIQHFTVKGLSDPAALETLGIPAVRVLAVTPHQGRLRVGHLKGNRFVIRYRGVPPGSLEAARAVLEILETRGVPNPYMEQRFGRDRHTHLLGRALLKRRYPEFLSRILSFGAGDGPWGADAGAAAAEGDWDGVLSVLPPFLTAARSAARALARGARARAAADAVPRRDRQLYVSALQSYLFNRLLAARLPDVDRLEAGDLAVLHRNGAVFEVLDPSAEEPRARALEISPSAPIYGSKVLLAGGRWGAVERALAEEEGFAPADWKLGKGLTQKGARRPLRFPLAEGSVEEDGGDLIFRFLLPKGCYATAVFREIGKGLEHSGGDG